MAKYPERHSAALPALAAAQRVHGWCSPEAIHQVAAVMQVTPAYLSSVATFYDMLRTSRSAAATSTSAPASPVTCATQRRSTRRSRRRPASRAWRASRSASSSAWARATWRRWRRRWPLRRPARRGRRAGAGERPEGGPRAAARARAFGPRFRLPWEEAAPLQTRSGTFSEPDVHPAGGTYEDGVAARRASSRRARPRTRARRRTRSTPGTSEAPEPPEDEEQGMTQTRLLLANVDEPESTRSPSTSASAGTARCARRCSR